MIAHNRLSFFVLGSLLSGLAAALASVLTVSEANALEQIIRPYQSARAAGMGNVRYTTGLYDENFFANPARIADNPTWRIDLANIMVEANKDMLSNLNDVTKGGDKVQNVANTAGTNNHVRAQVVLPALYFPKMFSDKHSMAIGLISSTQADVSLRKNYDVDPTAITDLSPAVSYARRLNTHTTLGITGRYSYRLSTNETFSTIDYIKGKNLSVKDAAGQGSTVDFDMGVTQKIEWKPLGWNLLAGAAIDNILGGNYHSGGLHLANSVTALPLQQPRTYNAGISATKEGVLGSNHLMTALEVTDVGNNPNGSMFRLLHLGAELNYWNYFFFRAGVNQGYLTGGIGLDFPGLKIDFATYGEEMSLNVGGREDRRYAVRVGISI